MALGSSAGEIKEYKTKGAGGEFSAGMGRMFFMHQRGEKSPPPVSLHIGTLTAGLFGWE